MDTTKIPKDFMRRDFMQNAKSVVDRATDESNVKKPAKIPWDGDLDNIHDGIEGFTRMPEPYRSEFGLLHEKYLKKELSRDEYYKEIHILLKRPENDTGDRPIGL